MKDKVIDLSKAQQDDLVALSDYIYRNPELGNQEYKACEAVIAYLQKNGFNVVEKIENIDTAFMATYDSNKPGPTVAYLCEYDALPLIGHGCGHNMIATMSAGAGVVLRNLIDEVGGKVHVFGTPAEETNGAKVPLTKAGYFNDCDAVMMVHPGSQTMESGSSLANTPLEFTYTGRTAHAAASPEKGINALNSVIALFNGIDALRQHVPSDVSMHGIISHGGDAANVVPDRAVTQWYLRAGSKEVLEDVLDKVKNIAKGAALMTGASLSISEFEFAYENLKTDQKLSTLFNENLRSLGINDILPPDDGFGSVDIGNISNVTATIHPYLAITDENLIAHTIEMAEATTKPMAYERLLIGVQALVLTGLDVLNHKS